jgi:hypothetical protein
MRTDVLNIFDELGDSSAVTRAELADDECASIKAQEG